YFADSTPLNIMNADRLYQLFPESYFINMLRDGRDVAYSVCQEKWGPSDPLLGLEWWKSRVLRGHLATAQLPQKNVLHMRLEDLVQRDREGSYAQLLNFLNLDHVEKMDTYFNEVLTVENMLQGVWKSEVNCPADFDRRYQQILKELAEQGLTIAQYY
ncbi:MAG: sulfotransferase, partial [Actinomycetota bacterium]